MPSSNDDHRRLLLIELSDQELTNYIDVVRAEADRLEDLFLRDRATLGDGPSKHGPLGKLRPRISRTRAKWRECRARQSAAEVEATKRRLFKSSDWDEPTLTDAERRMDQMGTD